MMLHVLFCFLLATLAVSVPHKNVDVPVSEVNCNGTKYTYRELAGYGFINSDARDKFGDTIGGIGSSIALQSWSSHGQGYKGVLWALPDRGWNTEGTLNYESRIHKFEISFTPNANNSNGGAVVTNLDFTYVDTIKLKDLRANPTTGIDAAPAGTLDFSDSEKLPLGKYAGDGFGGTGQGGQGVSIDSEGLVLGPDGSFWVSEEYGDYIYQFDLAGNMLQVIRPPDAFIPMRKGVESYSSASAPRYDPTVKVEPAQPESGRSNNQGLEDGGADKKTRRNSRLLKYDISSRPPTLVGEYVVQLPIYNGDKVAAQSEIHQVSDTQYMVLARDSGGAGQKKTKSAYRQIDVFDIRATSSIQSAKYDKTGGAIASSAGVLNPDITASTYCPFLDFNVNSELKKFGLHNGGDQDSGLLNEKWESIALAPVNDGCDGEYYLLSMSDNDFVTQHGALKDGTFKYADSSGYNLDTQALVFKVNLPKSGNC